MPAEVQTGLAVLWGIQSSASGGTIGISGSTEASGYASFTWDTAKGGHKFKLTTLEDEQDFDRSLIASNSHIELDITWSPTAATRSAVANATAFLTPLSKVTLSSFKVDRFNGDWVYVGDQTIDLSKMMGKMTLKIRSYDDPDQNASLTTTVSG